ncbi:MAG: hypothetical protein KY431_05400, partial [Actinobacteria bacterium]|nr:hypothetical protein [Actinomycetota bacterium]
VGGDGPELRVVECLDDSNGISEYPGGDYFGPMLDQYLATGRAAVGVVGRAPSELLDGADIVNFAVTWMLEHLPAS